MYQENGLNKPTIRMTRREEGRNKNEKRKEECFYITRIVWELMQAVH